MVWARRVHIGGPSRWFFFLSFFLYFSARASRGARYLKISARKRRRKGNTGKTEQNLTTRINEKMLSTATTIIHRNNCTLASIHPRLLQSPCPGRFPCPTSLELVIILRVRIAISFLFFSFISFRLSFWLFFYLNFLFFSFPLIIVWNFTFFFFQIRIREWIDKLGSIFYCWHLFLFSEPVRNEL